MKDLALLLDLFDNSEETKLLICTAIFVWCLQRQRNGGLNSGQKSAIIVTDAFIKYPVRHHFIDYHQGVVAERSKALFHRSWRGFESCWRHIFSFYIFQSQPVPNSSVDSMQMKSSMTIHL